MLEIDGIIYKYIYEILTFLVVLNLIGADFLYLTTVSRLLIINVMLYVKYLCMCGDGNSLV